MRRAVIACCLALTAAGCAAAEEEVGAPASAHDQAVPAPDQAVSAPAVQAPPPAGTPTPPRACRRLGRRLAGVPLQAATKRAERRGCPLRVAVRDGVGQVLTDDFQPARLNVHVREGVVTRVKSMG